MNTTIAIIMLIITGIIILGGPSWGLLCKSNKLSKTILGLSIVIIYNIFVFYWLDFFEYTGEKNVLMNKPNYKMEIKYKLKDSIHIPSDTIFVKIKK